jgi:hypothetical protein
LQRDGIINYSNYSVDYASNELKYELSLLDPTFPFHWIKGTTYFEGAGNKIHEIWINGEKRGSVILRPHQAYQFDFLIPKSLYQQNHKVNVAIKSPQGSGVYLAGLAVYRKVDNGSGGGPQSMDDNGKQSDILLTISPNPFATTTTFCFMIQDSRYMMIKIYDAAGRAVKTFSDFQCVSDNSVHSVVWDGRDNSGRLLPNGIYFIELKSNGESITEKVVMLK